MGVGVAGAGEGPPLGPKNAGADVRVGRGVAHRAVDGMLVEKVERGRPGVGAETLEGRPRGRRIAVADQLRLGVPGETVSWVGTLVGQARDRTGPRRTFEGGADPRGYAASEAASARIS